MAIKYVRIPMNDTEINIEIEPVADISQSPGFEALGVQDVQNKGGFENLGAEEQARHTVDALTAVAHGAFDKVEKTVVAVAQRFQTCIEQVHADAGSIEFGVGLSGEAGVVIKASGDATFKVVFSWENHQSDPNTQDNEH